MPAINAHGPRRLQPAHARHQIGLRGLHQQMVMIGQQDKSMDSPSRPPAGLAEGAEETSPIEVVAKDRFAPIAPIKQVINCAGELNARLASHAPEQSRSAQSRRVALCKACKDRPLGAPHGDGRDRIYRMNRMGRSAAEFFLPKILLILLILSNAKVTARP